MWEGVKPGSKREAELDFENGDLEFE